MTVLQQLDSLVDDFPRLAEGARQLQSPNQEDDLSIRSAIVGFSCNAPTEQWAHNHFLFVKEKLDLQFAIENLADYEPYPMNIRLFAALAFGYLLGLYQTDRISERDFRLAEAQLPGVIALRCDKLLAKAVD